MAAKDVLKHWVTLIDNALLKEEKRRGTHHAPAPSAPGEPSPTRREAVVAEDMHIGETDTTTLRSAIQSLRDHTTVPVDIDANIYALIAPTDIQITSPHTIAPALLEPFKTGAKEVTLIFLTGKKPPLLPSIRCTAPTCSSTWTSLPSVTGCGSTYSSSFRHSQKNATSCRR